MRTQLEEHFGQIWQDSFEEYVDLLSTFPSRTRGGVEPPLSGELGDLDLAEALVRDFQVFLENALAAGLHESDALAGWRGFFEGRFDGYIEVRLIASISAYNHAPSRENLLALESVILRLCDVASSYHAILRRGHADQAQMAIVLSELWAFRGIIILLLANSRTSSPIGYPQVSSDYHSAWTDFGRRAAAAPEGDPLFEARDTLQQSIQTAYLSGVVRAHDSLVQ
jgi:hypothetical protein